MSKTILKVQNVEKYYGNSGVVTKAINNISFQACEGDFIGIMGASGSGKTTLLNCISTIDKVTSGHIYIEDKDVTELNKKEIAKFRREELGFIFQDFNILDTLTTYENIALALSIMKIDSENIDKK
ncbi:ABC transporter, ATP-binding protein [Clostridium carboxidivorans P7]|nr:ABC transporter, ATP-binding protein [Clostridium carboxidivorans P7]